MATEKRQIEYVKKYQQKAYRVPLYIPAGQRDALTEHAKDKGHDSLNAYLKWVIEQDSGLSMDIKKDAGES